MFSHTDGKVAHGHTGDVACDHHHGVDDDVAMMADLGLQSYRFSISWSRVMPDGRGRINQEGLGFYQRLVDRLLGHGIVPSRRCSAGTSRRHWRNSAASATATR